MQERSNNRNVYCREEQVSMSGPSLLQYLDSADRGGGPGGQQRRGCEEVRLEDAGEHSG